MILSIDIRKDKVYEEVIKITQYTALKVASGDEAADSISQERISANEFNEELFDRYFSDSETHLLSETRRYRSAESDGEEEGVLSVKLTMPAAWDDTKGSDIGKMAENYFIYNIVSKWMRLVKHEEETKYSGEGAAELENIRNLLNVRKPLTRDFFG